MARFIGELKGTRGGTSRLGDAKNGLRVSVNGWNKGIYVKANVIDGEDVFEVYITGGTNGYISNLIATVGGNEVKLGQTLQGVLYADQQE